MVYERDHRGACHYHRETQNIHNGQHKINISEYLPNYVWFTRLGANLHVPKARRNQNCYQQQDIDNEDEVMNFTDNCQVGFQALYSQCLYIFSMLREYLCILYIEILDFLPWQSIGSDNNDIYFFCFHYKVDVQTLEFVVKIRTLATRCNCDYYLKQSSRMENTKIRWIFNGKIFPDTLHLKSCSKNR